MNHTCRRRITKKEERKMFRKKIFILAMIAIVLIGMSAVTAVVEHLGLPRLDELSFKVIKTEDAEVDALLAGEVDTIIGPLKTENLDRVAAAGYEQTWDLEASYGHMQINCRDYFPEEAGEIAGLPVQPLNDTAFRQALSYVFGMDRKAESILGYYGGPQVFAAANIMPPAEVEWFFGDVYPLPDTDLDAAWTILQDAGYTVVDGVLNNPDGSPVRDLEVLYSAGALAWEKIGGDFVSYMNEFMTYIGATTSPTFSLVARDFTSLVYSLLAYHDFDLLLIGLTNLGKDPDWLRDLFHTDNIGPWGWNTVGLVDPYVDDLMDTMYYDLDRADVLQACLDFQMYFPEILPHFPMTNSFEIVTYDAGLDNYIAQACYGSAANELTWYSINWEGAPVGGLVRRSIGDEPDTLHPWFDDTAYGRYIMGTVMQGGDGDQLFVLSPTLKDVPWVAYRWEVEYWTWPALGIEEGTKISFYLRNDVTWHDGTPFTAHDMKFQYDMFMKYHPSRYADVIDPLVYIETEGDYIIHAYFNRTSLWYLYDASVGMLAPEHIWSIVDQMVEDGTLATVQDFDPQTPYKDLTGIDPPSAYPFMKAGLVGTGPMVFDYYDDSLMVGSVKKYQDYWVQSPVEAAVDAYFRVDPAEDGGSGLPYNVVLTNTGAHGGSFANVTVDVNIYVDDVLEHTESDVLVPGPIDYTTIGPYTTDPLSRGTHTIKVEVIEAAETIDTYTHTVYATITEDLDLNDRVNILDIARAAVAFGSKPGHPRWDPVADVDDTFAVNILDIARIAKKFGWPPA